MSEETITNEALPAGPSAEAPQQAGPITMNDAPPAESSEPRQEESFAALFEQSTKPAVRLEPGAKIKAKVISVAGDSVYIDLGGKSEGVIALSELLDEQGAPKVKEGDEIEAFFLSVQDGVKHLTTLVNGYSSVKLTAVREAYESGMPIMGEVKAEVKGGFEVSIGGVRCFCPASQIDGRGRQESGSYLKQTFPFKVIEYKNDGRNVVVSRRAVLEQERAARVAALKETLAVGMEVPGRVRSLQKFGAFVDLGGIDGLIPMSELSWGRVDKAGDMLAAGQEVTAKVIAIDWEANRLTLSLKALQADPWAAAAERYPVGSKVNGTIVRLAPFGAFVALEPGLDGLVHVSNLGAGRRINHPKEVVQTGQQVEAYVIAVDPQSRKLSLSLQPKQEPKKVVLPAAGERFEGTVEKVMPFGIFVKNSDGLSGLVPNSEMGTARGADHGSMFPAGSAMQAVVLEVDTDKGKVLLSRKKIMDRVEEDEYKQYRESVKKEEKSSGGMGTLGEMLQAKMKEKNITFK
ncbi:MAG: S1 RNA-binding domain-containing protein [Nitrospirota bacterium]